jgi:hypothetical protein
VVKQDYFDNSLFSQRLSATLKAPTVGCGKSTAVFRFMGEQLSFVERRFEDCKEVFIQLRLPDRVNKLVELYAGIVDSAYNVYVNNPAMCGVAIHVSIKRDELDFKKNVRVFFNMLVCIQAYSGD